MAKSGPNLGTKKGTQNGTQNGTRNRTKNAKNAPKKLPHKGWLGAKSEALLSGEGWAPDPLLCPVTQARCPTFP